MNRQTNTVKIGNDEYRIVRNITSGKNPFFGYNLILNDVKVDWFMKYRQAQKAITSVKNGQKTYLTSQ